MIMTEAKNIVRDAPDDLMLSYARKAIDGNKLIYCLEQDKFYIYRDGYWQYIHELEILDLVNMTIRITHLNLNQTQNIIRRMKQLIKIRLERFNSYSLMNLENYMIDPVDGNVCAHKDEYYSTNRIPYKYDPNASCELWLKTLAEIFESNEQKINILQEFTGYCLSRDTRQEKSLLLLGESRSGKSTVLNTLQYLIGINNCAHVPLKYLNNPQYTEMMLNKLVNIDGEVSRNAQDFEAEFKQIVTGHEISCNPKYVKGFTFRPFCKLILAANIFPKITDHSSAFYNRLILIPCDRIFKPEEQNKNLREDLLKELPGILNWSLKGFIRLQKRGAFESTEFMREAIEELEDENNPVNIFCRECIEVSMNSELEKGETFIRYLQWCDETKNFKLSKARFASAFYKVFSKETPKQVQNHASGKRIWRNLKFKGIETPNKGWQDEA